MDGRAQVALGRVSTTENETIQLLAWITEGQGLGQPEHLKIEKKKTGK